MINQISALLNDAHRGYDQLGVPRLEEAGHQTDDAVLAQLLLDLRAAAQRVQDLGAAHGDGDQLLVGLVQLVVRSTENLVRHVHHVQLS